MNSEQIAKRRAKQRIKKPSAPKAAPEDPRKEEDKSTASELSDGRSLKRHCGDHENCHLRWAFFRQQWLDTKLPERDTPYAKHKSTHVPRDIKKLTQMRSIMRSYCPPYDQFTDFYPLKEVIGVYDEIWKEESDDS